MIDLNFLVILQIVAGLAGITGTILALDKKRDKKSGDYFFHSLKLQPGDAQWRSPFGLPTDATRVYIEKVGLLVENVDPKAFYLAAMSNPKEFEKLWELAKKPKQERYLLEGDIKGELYFPMIRMEGLEMSPRSKIEKSILRDNCFRITMDINQEMSGEFSLILANSPGSSSEVSVEGYVTTIVERSILNKIKRKALAFAKRVN